jgi:hypothetical protein
MSKGIALSTIVILSLFIYFTPKTHFFYKDESVEFD